MYAVDDPRSSMNVASGSLVEAQTGFGAAEYVHFYEQKPLEDNTDSSSWYARGQNFVLAVTKPSAGALFSRQNQSDEYAVLLPEPKSLFEISTNREVKAVNGGSLLFMPPGDSSVRVLNPGLVVRIFTVRAKDLVAKCSNAESYAQRKPFVAPATPWPDPIGGFKIRAYDLDPPSQKGRFGRIWRCTTLMINYCNTNEGPRDPTKLSPHHHDDFEQGSLSVAGEFVHHLRWPWTVNRKHWRADEHEYCGSPSIAVIPPPATHTTEAVGSGTNQLVDIFCPPRRDFSEKPGWVLNADEYPMP